MISKSETFKQKVEPKVVYIYINFLLKTFRKNFCNNIESYILNV